MLLRDGISAILDLRAFTLFNYLGWKTLFAWNVKNFIEIVYTLVFHFNGIFWVFIVAQGHKEWLQNRHSRRIYISISSRQSAAFSSATQHTTPLEFGVKWGTECFNTRFLLPTLLRAGYSVKLILWLFGRYGMLP